LYNNRLYIGLPIISAFSVGTPFPLLFSPDSVHQCIFVCILHEHEIQNCDNAFPNLTSVPEPFYLEKMHCQLLSVDTIE